MARVPLRIETDLPDDKQHLLTSFRPKIPPGYEHLLSREQRNVYRALAHAPASLEAFRAMGGAIREETGFTPRERELVILTAARELDSAYEWHQHVRIGLTEGLTPEEIRAIADADYGADGFDESERVLMEYTAAYVTGDVPEDTFKALADATDHRTVVATGMLAGMYLVIARQMTALDVETEEPFVGWQLEHLDPPG